MGPGHTGQEGSGWVTPVRGRGARRAGVYGMLWEEGGGRREEGGGRTEAGGGDGGELRGT